MYFNRIDIMGHVGKDPEVREIKGGKRMAIFSIATTDYYKVAGEKKQDTQWHNIVCFGGQVDIVEKFIKKGMNILITGKMTYNTYEDNSGVKRTSAQIMVTNINFSFKQFNELTGSEQSEGNKEEKTQPEIKKQRPNSKAGEPGKEEELPF